VRDILAQPHELSLHMQALLELSPARFWYVWLSAYSILITWHICVFVVNW